MTIASLILITGLLYLLSLTIASFGKITDAKNKKIFAIVSLGFVCHTVAIIIRYFQIQRFSISTSYELIELIAWLLVAVQLSITLLCKIRLVGIFSMLPATVLTLLPICCPLFIEKMGDSPRASVSYAAAHAILAAISYATLATSAIFASLYLKQQTALKNKKSLSKIAYLPSLETLDKGETALLSTSTIAMLASVLIGIVSSLKVEITDMLILKFSMGILLLILQMILCYLAISQKYSGSKLSKSIIVLFTIALLLLIPINMGK